jgi:protein-disulfide isomerase
MLTSLGFTQQSQSDDKSDDISELRGQVTALAKQQQEILDRLNELKQLITASVSRPGPQLPAPSAIASKNENFRGASNATIAIIEYADFECPFCGEYEHDTYPQISKDYIQTGKVKYFFCDLPLSVHPHAMGAARAARCAGEQGKFWEMHDSLYAKQNALRDVDMPDRALELGLDKTKFSECLVSDRYTNEIKQSMAEAQKMGIAGTPMFFIGKIEANGQLTNMKPIIGARPYETFKAAIDALLGATN